MHLKSLLAALCAGATPLLAQSPDDGTLMSKRAISAGVLYANDRWSEYWEGTLRRSNGNVGTLTTQSITLVGGYGLTDRISLMAMLPYVWTDASEGTVAGHHGLQDVMLAAKYRLLSTPFTSAGTLNAFVVAAAGIPVSDYSPDYMPFSIGSGSSRASARFTLNFQSPGAWFTTASAAHTWRNNVHLDRESYYANGQLYNTNEVAMPEVFDYTLSAGYRRGRLQIPLAFTEQRTLGGSDIRRQDQPFVSNRMNFTRIEGAAMYALPVPKDVTVRASLSRILTGRNVGQSTTFTTGMFYAFSF